MNINYGKVVDFLLPSNVNKKGLNIVLEEVLNNYYMIDVNSNIRAISLSSKIDKKPYVISSRNSGIMMATVQYKTLNFTDDFGEIIEMRCNEDNDVVLSSIIQYDNPKGICISVSIWHNEEENKFTQVSGRIFFIGYDDLSIIKNKLSIEMFINQYQLKRNDIYCDLYWDMYSLTKAEFINIKNNERIQINDGYNKETFKDLYKKYIEKVSKTVKSSIF